MTNIEAVQKFKTRQAILVSIASIQRTLSDPGTSLEQLTQISDSLESAVNSLLSAS